MVEHCTTALAARSQRRSIETKPRLLHHTSGEDEDCYVWTPRAIAGFSSFS